jgi:predicted  nucleic acid-binding Zn-ribbon protein
MTGDSKMSLQKVKTPIKCEKCGYTWAYKGKMRRTTCPNCGNKTRTPNPLETISPSNPSIVNPQEDNTFDMLKKYLES